MLVPAGSALLEVRSVAPVGPASVTRTSAGAESSVRTTIGLRLFHVSVGRVLALSARTVASDTGGGAGGATGGGGAGGGGAGGGDDAARSSAKKER